MDRQRPFPHHLGTREIGEHPKESVLESARKEIRQSWWLICEDNRDLPRVSVLFGPGRLPAFHDPFPCGDAIPLEARRLGLEALTSDLIPGSTSSALRRRLVSFRVTVSYPF